uniref:XK-related protein n=1 Tax=Mesocestoides corti TaxID=53468 RepID=A0A5K3EIE6_MESCO
IKTYLQIFYHISNLLYFFLIISILATFYLYFCREALLGRPNSNENCTGRVTQAYQTDRPHC